MLISNSLNGNTCSMSCYCEHRRHVSRSDYVLLVGEIQRIPQAAIQRVWLRNVVISQPSSQRQSGSNLPFILQIGRPGSVAEFHGTTVRNRELGCEAAWKAQQRRRER